MKKVGSIRPEFLKGPIIYGRVIYLYLPTGVSRKGQFAVVELDDIIASHNEKSFSDSKGYPRSDLDQNINDRNYSGDLSAQAAVKGYAQNLVPERIISTSREESGTPIISPDGFVVSGNNRTMSLKLAADEFPDRYEAYKQFLQEEAFTVGIDDLDAQLKEQKIKQPVLVRFDYDFPEYTTAEMSYYNKGAMKVEKLIDKIIKLSKILETSDHCTEVIANVIGQYENASDFFEIKLAQKVLADHLIECKILTTQELPAYYDNGVFTRVGKDFVENLLAAMVLSEKALIAANQPGVKKFRNIIITSLLVLIRNSQLDPGSLKEDINQALILQYRIHESGLEFDQYMNQTALWEEQVSPKSAYLNRLLSKGRNAFKSAIEGYNKTVAESESSEGMFGDNPNPDEAFEFYVIDAIDTKERELIQASTRVTSSPPVETLKRGQWVDIIDGEYKGRMGFISDNKEPGVYRIGDRIGSGYPVKREHVIPITEEEEIRLHKKRSAKAIEANARDRARAKLKLLQLKKK